MKKVLVTGGTGFIGSHLVEQLLARGVHVRIPTHSGEKKWLSDMEGIEWMQGDLRDPAFCTTLVDGIDTVFHLASLRKNVAFHHDHACDVVAANTLMTLGLLGALRDHPAIPVIFFSTANIPPDADVRTLGKSGCVDGYVLGKALCEELWQSAARERGFPLLIIRPVGVYGPRDGFSVDGTVIASLMVKAKQSTDQLTVWGSGAQERSFLYVEDLPKAVLQLVDAGATGVQHVTSPETVTIRVLAEKIRDLVHPGLSLAFDTAKPEGQLKIPPPPVHACLRGFPWTPLDEGLGRTMELV